MQITLLVTLVLHILSGVFWAGSTFVLARTGAATAVQLFRPQMGAAVVAVITGGVLWHLLHPSGFGTMEQIIAFGALAAVLAAGAQGALCGRALRQLARNGEKDTRLKMQVVLGHQIAAVLLALTVICMAAARYA
jgi:F0F1-type ATP synthase membrane subunit c/vacuolar-type H+-ATPase subunit K